MHPAMRRQSAAGHIREPATGAGDARRAGKRECGHRPQCPDALARSQRGQDRGTSSRAGVEPAVQRRGAI